MSSLGKVQIMIKTCEKRFQSCSPHKIDEPPWCGGREATGGWLIEPHVVSLGYTIPSPHRNNLGQFGTFMNTCFRILQFVNKCLKWILRGVHWKYYSLTLETINLGHSWTHFTKIPTGFRNLYIWIVLNIQSSWFGFNPYTLVYDKNPLRRPL